VGGPWVQCAGWGIGKGSRDDRRRRGFGVARRKPLNCDNKSAAMLSSQKLNTGIVDQR
jgi:hypothetical protein